MQDDQRSSRHSAAQWRERIGWLPSPRGGIRFVFRPSTYRQKKLYSASASYCRSSATVLIDDRSPSVEIPGSANQVDLVEAARQKSEAATEARTSAWSIRARSKLGRCGCARFPANRLQARIW